MYNHGLYLRTLSEFTRVLLTPYDVHVVLRELADRVTDVLDLLGSGVILAIGDRLEFDTAYGAEIAELERAQEDGQSGPCVSAFKTGTVVAVPDLADESDTWPEYCRVAAQLHITAVASIPMRLAEQTVGALNLYARGARDWPEDDLAAASVMADMATAYLINASHHRQQVDLNVQLQHALDSRLIIEQAKGMVAAKRGINPEQAFDVIRRYARSHAATVRSVADAVVTLGLEI